MPWGGKGAKGGSPGFQTAPSPGSANIMCKFFAQGQCLKGTACPFLHPGSGGWSAFGMGWGDAQPQAQQMVAGPASSTRHWQPIMCSFYMNGACAKGNTCPYVHAANESDSYEDFTIEQRVVGWLIGEKGKMITEMQNATGCKITIDEATKELGYSKVNLYGGPDLRRQCKVLIQERWTKEKGDLAEKREGKGKGKGKGRAKSDQQDQEQSPILEAILPATAAIIHLERELDSDKLAKKIHQYCQNALKGLDFSAGLSWTELVDAYADKFFTSVWQVFGERSWMASAQDRINFRHVLNSSVCELFPDSVLDDVPSDDLEQHVFQSHDRACDEQRALLLIWDRVKTIVDRKKSQNPVYNAAESARKETWSEFQGIHGEEISGSSDHRRKFLRSWVRRTISEIGGDGSQHPGMVLPDEMARKLFLELATKGGMPEYPGIEVQDPEEGWGQTVSLAVLDAYRSFGKVPQPRAKANFDRKTMLCWYFENAECVRGYDCPFSHGDDPGDRPTIFPRKRKMPI